jgi:hypothetical protein
MAIRSKCLRRPTEHLRTNLIHPDAWKPPEPANEPSPNLKITLSPSDGKRAGVRGPRPTPILAMAAATATKTAATMTAPAETAAK